MRAVARRTSQVLLGALLLAAAATGVAHAQDGSSSCLTADPPPVTQPAQPLRFGITPQVAGAAGAAQGQPAPVDDAATLRELGRLRPPGRDLVLRLNRLFWSDGAAGIRDFAARVDGYARAGFSSEVQLRYHPGPGQEGDIAGWTAFVRAAVRELAPRPAVVALSITNEGNLPISPNTSDGAYKGVVDALVQGTVAAREEAVAVGRPDLALGFTFAWRWSPQSDGQFWTDIGRKGGDAFRRAVTYVGLQVYPGLVWPPAPIPGRTAGREVTEALTLVRQCYMPKAGLGPGVKLWVSENGYPTNLGRDEPTQVTDLDSTIRDVHALSGTLGVTDYRYFNLRDNRSQGSDLFDAVGLLRDDYAEKPAFGAFRGLVGLFGAPVAATPAGSRVRPGLQFAVRRRPGRRFTTTGRLLLPVGLAPGTACRGTATVQVKIGRRTISARRAKVRPDCRFASSVAFARRRLHGTRRVRLTVRFGGNALLRRAVAGPRSVRV